jgi:hypothetical protein
MPLFNKKKSSDSTPAATDSPILAHPSSPKQDVNQETFIIPSLGEATIDNPLETNLFVDDQFVLLDASNTTVGHSV